MPNKTLWPSTKQVRGFIPALDRRQLPSPSVVEGRNFLIDAEGPYSAFGTRLPTYAQFRNIPAETCVGTSFRVAGQLYHFTNSGVMAYDTVQHSFYPVLVFSTPNLTAFPWSFAIVGGKYYFAKKGSNLIQYDPTTVSWNELTVNVPSGVVAVTAYGDRLIVLGNTVVARSAISDGADLATSSITGAGFQALALIGGGDPLGVRKIPTGFVVFTSEGMMLAEAINAIVPFRYRALDHDYRPISPYCILEIEQDIIFLAKQGFYQTRGQVPQPWEEVMSEYFRRQILNKIDLDTYGIIRMHYNVDRQWFMISVTNSETPFRYDLSYVLYTPVKQWGLFNRQHINFLELQLTEGIDEGFNFGYVDLDGFFHKFTDDPFVDVTPTDLPALLHYSESLNAVTRTENGVIVFASGMKIYDYPINKLTQGPGLYDFNNIPVYSDISIAQDEASSLDGGVYVFRSTMRGGNGFVLYIPQLFAREQGSIDSYIHVGVYRMSEQQAADEISLVSQVMIGTDQLGVGSEEEDWNTFSPSVEEDWLNDSLTDEDYGVGLSAETDFTVRLLGTLDGKAAFNYPAEILTKYYQAENARFYPANTEGVYHITQIEALALGQSYHLKLQELSGMIVGRL